MLSHIKIKIIAIKISRYFVEAVQFLFGTRNENEESQVLLVNSHKNNDNI